MHFARLPRTNAWIEIWYSIYCQIHLINLNYEMNSFQIKWRVHGEREKERGRLPKDDITRWSPYWWGQNIDQWFNRDRFCLSWNMHMKSIFSIYLAKQGPKVNMNWSTLIHQESPKRVDLERAWDIACVQ